VGIIKHLPLLKKSYVDNDFWRTSES
jgi:hypothetical protein